MPFLEKDFNNLIKLIREKKNLEFEKKIKKFLNENKNSFILMNILGFYYKTNSRILDAENTFKKSIKIKENSDAYNNIGLIKAEKKEIDEAIFFFKKAININNKNPSYLNNLGNALAELKLLDEAKEKFNDAISLDKNFFQSYNNLGLIYKDQNNYDEAINFFKKAIQLNPNFADAYLNLGITNFKIGEINQALVNVIKSTKINKNFANAYINLGNILKDQGLSSQALNSYKKAIDINPKLSEAYNNIGTIFSSENNFDKAYENYKKAIDLKPNYYEAFNNLGNLFAKKKNYLEAINYYDKALKINNEYASAQIAILYNKLQICDFSALKDFKEKYRFIGIKNDEINPFYTLAMEDNPSNQYHRSKNFSRKRLEKFANKIKFPKVSKNRRIKIGFYSSDFYEHATMYLISGLFREYNKEKFEFYTFNYSKHKPSERIKQILSNTNEKNILNLPDIDVVKLSRELNIDIAIDLKGYTLDSRTKLFSYRLAPIQVNYLGYPGTIGASFIDYLIADKIVIPQKYKKYYSEKILYMPNCYQPNDDMRDISKSEIKRKDQGLPNNAFVFCSFNNVNKISTNELTIWSNILNQVEGSVIWLMKPNNIAENNILNFFKDKNIKKDRIIFADNIIQEKHLERIKLADLFLDTFNYNAHTTCSDALWAGLPLVTKIGDQFASRVAASLLNSLEMNELVTNNLDNYEKLIIKLAKNNTELEKIKKKLRKNLISKPLFDTKKYVYDFENLMSNVYNEVNI